MFVCIAIGYFLIFFIYYWSEALPLADRVIFDSVLPILYKKLVKNKKYVLNISEVYSIMKVVSYRYAIGQGTNTKRTEK